MGAGFSSGVLIESRLLVSFILGEGSSPIYVVSGDPVDAERGVGSAILNVWDT